MFTYKWQKSTQLWILSDTAGFIGLGLLLHWFWPNTISDIMSYTLKIILEGIYRNSKE